jgi:putative transposase
VFNPSIKGNGMPNYRRTFIPGATWFFTVNLLECHGNSLLTDKIDLLKACIKQVYRKYPFHIGAWVVHPEHMRCVWTLPEGAPTIPHGGD